MIIEIEKKQDRKAFFFSIKTESGVDIGKSKEYRAKDSAKKALRAMKRNIPSRTRIENIGTAIHFIVKSANGMDVFQSGHVADRETAQQYIDMLAEYLSSGDAKVHYNDLYERI